jgi:PhoH-like ATPase
MPLPSLPSKLGDLLPADQYKARLRPSPASKKKSAHAEDANVATVEDVEYLPTAAAELSGTSIPAAMPAALRDPQTPPVHATTRSDHAVSAVSPAAQPIAAAAPANAHAAPVSDAPATAAPVAHATPAPNTARISADDALHTRDHQKIPENLRHHTGGSHAGAQQQPRPQKGGARGAAVTTRTKLFVLDTNVLLHDPSSLFRFEEHDVYLPMMTLEELDNNKKGMSEVARNARQVSRILDGLVAGDVDIQAGLQLSRLGNREARGRLFFQTSLKEVPPVAGLPAGKADNQILGVVRALEVAQPERDIVLVSKDINMRIKAHALQLAAEDYYNDQVLEDKDLLYTGVLALQKDFWTRHGKGMESWQDVKTGTTFYRLTGPSVPAMLINQFVYLEPNNGEPAFHAIVREINGRTALLQTLHDFGHRKNNVWGVTARNREQNFALNLLMNPDVDFVSLLGQAGTGKTLLALAAGLAQVLDDKRYNEIIVTRATVPVGEDIGFLPGTEEEKMQPWMGAFDDNLEVLQKSDDSAGEWGRAATQDLIRSRLKVKSMNFMRGRTFVDKYVIIDEAQNLTPKQMKTLVTRAGPGTKIVCLGNIAQIDTPYLTEGSSGLTYVVDRLKGWPHGGHVTLARGERSRLADYASDNL